MLGPCLLPWKDDYTLDERIFRKHIKSTIKLGFQHIYLMGTVGEGYGLTEQQFEQVVTTFLEEMQEPALQPMVGVISLSMGQIIQRIRFAYKLGTRHFQISLPSWGALTDSEMECFFQQVCGTFPDAKFLHYNLLRAKRIVTGPEYRRIADKVPNLVATKNSTSDYARVEDLMTHVPDLQHVFVENAFAFGCLLGECSLLSSVSGLFPKLSERLFTLGQNRQIAELMRVHQLINSIGNVLFEHITEPHIDGAYDKLLIWLQDPCFPLRLLPPYKCISDEEALAVRQAFETHFADLE